MKQRAYALAFEHSLDAVILLDDHGRVIHPNRAARELLGRIDRPLEADARLLLELVHVHGEARHEVHARDRDGSERRLSMYGVRLEARAYAITIHDGGRRTSVEDPSLEVTAAVHDLRNLVHPIALLSVMIARHAPPDTEVAQLARDLVASADRAARLVHGILTKRGVGPLAVDRVSVSNVVAEIAGIVRRSLGSGIRLDLALDPRELAAEIDAEELERVVLNLVSNARHAMPRGGALSITTKTVVLSDEDAARLGCSAPGEHVVLSVRDDGTGMSEAVRARLFSCPFTTKGSAGSGFGLTSAHRFVVSAGGAITVESALGVGTTVSLHLPRVAPR